MNVLGLINKLTDNVLERFKSFDNQIAAILIILEAQQEKINTLEDLIRELRQR